MKNVTCLGAYDLDEKFLLRVVNKVQLPFDETYTFSFSDVKCLIFTFSLCMCSIQAELNYTQDQILSVVSKNKLAAITRHMLLIFGFRVFFSLDRFYLCMINLCSFKDVFCYQVHGDDVWRYDYSPTLVGGFDRNRNCSSYITTSWNIWKTNNLNQVDKISVCCK